MTKDIFINNNAYTITEEVFYQLEFIQKEMQGLVNENQFGSEDYMNLKKLFSMFLRIEIKRNKAVSVIIKSEFYYYTN